MFGPYRVAADVALAAPEGPAPVPPARVPSESDELAPVVRAHDGPAPVEKAIADRIALARAAGFMVLCVLWLGSALLLDHWMRAQQGAAPPATNAGRADACRIRESSSSSR